MSMPETRAGTTQQGSRGRDNSIHLSIVVKTQGNGGQMGIGIFTENEDKQVVAQWPLKEHSSRNNLMDNAAALKLALIKARE